MFAFIQPTGHYSNDRLQNVLTMEREREKEREEHTGNETETFCSVGNRSIHQIIHVHTHVLGFFIYCIHILRILVFDVRILCVVFWVKNQ